MRTRNPLKYTREWRNKLNQDWIANNRQKYNASKYKYRESLKLEVLTYYRITNTLC